MDCLFTYGLQGPAYGLHALFVDHMRTTGARLWITVPLSRPEDPETQNAENNVNQKRTTRRP
eukprot:4172222-Amphidinium_carterae.1